MNVVGSRAPAAAAAARPLASRAAALPRVCHLSSVHTGVEIRIVRKELATLAAAGFPSSIVIACTEGDAAEMHTLGIDVHRLEEPGATGGRGARMTKLAARTYRLARQVNAGLYHFHDPELIPVGLALKALGKRVIYDVHEDLAGIIAVRHWIKSWIRKPLARGARGLEHFAAKRFDAVVTATPFIATIFAQHAKQVQPVRNFPMLGELIGGAADVPWSARTHVAYIGGISRHRGIAEVVDALPIADLRLRLAGNWFTELERSDMHARPGWSHVEDLGYVGRAGVRDLLASSFAGLCTLYPVPNHVNADPIKLFEYMAAGIPVVCSTIPRWQKLVDEHRCGLCVDPKNPQAIAEALGWLRDHPQDAQRMGTNGRNAVLEHYNWDREGERLVALYRSILEH